MFADPKAGRIRALGYGLSVAVSVSVAVGFISLAGVAVETRVLTLLYLDGANGERALIPTLCETLNMALSGFGLIEAMFEKARQTIPKNNTTYQSSLAGYSERTVSLPENSGKRTELPGELVAGFGAALNTQSMRIYWLVHKRIMS